MEAIVLLLIIVIMIYGFYLCNKTKDFFNPITTFIAPIFLGYLIFLRYYNNGVSNISLVIYFLGIVSYFIGFLLHRTVSRYKLKYNMSISKRAIYMNTNTEKIFQLVSIISLFLTFIYVLKNMFAGPFGTNFIRNLRYISLYESSKGIFATYGLVVAMTLLKIYFYKFYVENNKSKKKWLIILIIAAIISILSTVARTTIIGIVCSLYYLYSIRNKINRKSLNMNILKRINESRKGLTIIILVGFIFIIISASTNKLGEANIFSESFFFNKYMGQQIYNFDKYILNYKYTGGGYYCLGVIGKIFAAFKIIPNDIITEIGKNIGNPVYSFVSGPYVDFGIIGVILFMFIMGILNSFIYSKALKYGGYWSIFYTTCIYSNIMAFYAFQYLMSDQIYLLVLIIILQISNFKLKVRRQI